MSLFLPMRRATLLIPSGTVSDPNKKHLFILLTDPVDNAETGTKDVLMVSVSTFRQGMPHDPTCKLYPGDHPFIKWESFVSYRTARIEPAQKVQNGVTQGVFIPQGTIDGAILARICQGLLDSRQAPPKMQTFYLRATGQG